MRQRAAAPSHSLGAAIVGFQPRGRRVAPSRAPAGRASCRRGARLKVNLAWEASPASGPDVPARARPRAGARALSGHSVRRARARRRVLSNMESRNGSALGWVATARARLGPQPGAPARARGLKTPASIQTALAGPRPVPAARRPAANARPAAGRARQGAAAPRGQSRIMGSVLKACALVHRGSQKSRATSESVKPAWFQRTRVKRTQE